MKKLLVISDVHRDRHRLEGIINRVGDQVDYRLSVGDTELSLSYLQRKHIISVKGNYPFDGGESYHKHLDVEDVHIFMTHGHKFNVKRNNIDTLQTYASQHNCDLVLYGHTHIASIDYIGHTLFVNPGSVKQPRGHLGASYAIITIDQDQIQVSFFDALTYQEITV